MRENTDAQASLHPALVSASTRTVTFSDSRHQLEGERSTMGRVWRAARRDLPARSWDSRNGGTNSRSTQLAAAWVVGDEPVVVVDWFGASTYAKRA